MEIDNLKLWNNVFKTNPKHTKGANVRGNKITCIAPQSQILAATEQFGPYGTAWGFNEIDIDVSLMTIGLALFKGVFYYPGGEFPIINSIGLYKDNAKTKIDDDFAKKVETDALTKALSKLGFNGDVFMGLFDDTRYVNEMKEEFAEAEEPIELDEIAISWVDGINSGTNKLEEIIDLKYRKFIEENLK